MGSLFCKGLHCAGCGKGIPAGVVVIIIAYMLAGGGGNAIGGALDALANALIIFAVVAGICLIIASLIVARIIRKCQIYTVSRWNGPTYSEQKAIIESKRLAITNDHVTVPFTIMEEDNARYVDVNK